MSRLGRSREDDYKLIASLGYIATSRRAWAIEQDPASKQSPSSKQITKLNKRINLKRQQRWEFLCRRGEPLGSPVGI